MIGGARAAGWAGLACATGAVGLGLLYLAAAGAPVRMIALNIAAWLVGLAAYLTFRVPQWRADGLRHWLAPALGGALLATALLGTTVEGAARWVMLGPLVLQPSLVVVPPLLILFARAATGSGLAGVVLAALALALQPDRAMAGALLAGVAACAVFRRDRTTLAALAAAGAALAAALAQPDVLPAVPFVDRIFFTAFAVHPLVGAALLAGSALLLVPALLRPREAGEQLPAAVFGACWLAIIAAAALGNYPTPVVGYGGSAIVGYLLSLAVLRPKRAYAGEARRPLPADRREGPDRSLSASLA